MPFETTHIQDRARKMVMEFAEREITPHLDKLRKGDKEFMEELYDKEARACFHLALIPREEGGLGFGQSGRVVIEEELVAAWPHIPATIHQEFAWYFARACGGEVSKKWMPLILKGEARAAPLINEPQGGSDILNLTTRAYKEGDFWVISGRKCFIAGGHRADFGMVLAKTGDPNDPKTPGIRSLSAFIVERDMEGFKVERVEKSMAVGEDFTASITLENVRVPESYLVPPGVGRGLTPTFAAVWDIGRLGTSAMLVGCILGCCRCVISFVKERFLYGKPIYELQAIRHRIAEMYVDLAAARALIYRAAWLRDKGISSRMEQSIAKYFATQAAERSALHAINIHGGSGVMEDYLPQAYFRFVPLLISAGGTDEIMKDTIGRVAVEGANPTLGEKPAEESGFSIP